MNKQEREMIELLKQIQKFKPKVKREHPVEKGDEPDDFPTGFDWVRAGEEMAGDDESY